MMSSSCNLTYCVATITMSKAGFHESPASWKCNGMTCRAPPIYLTGTGVEFFLTSHTLGASLSLSRKLLCCQLDRSRGLHRTHVKISVTLTYKYPVLILEKNPPKLNMTRLPQCEPLSTTGPKQ